jgi:hypothetical protein
MMAVPISVPVSQRRAIEELAKLSDDGFVALRQCLDEGPAYSVPGDFAEHAAKAVSPHTTLGGQIVSAIIGLRSVMDRTERPIGDVASGVATDLATKSNLAPEAQKVLVERLMSLLSIKSVATSAKAFSLSMADPTPFSDVQIISDIRPIFASKDSATEVSGAIVVHHLLIETASTHDDQHCTLTTADLLTLKRAVERALQKDRTLREALRGGPLAPLDGPTA